MGIKVKPTANMPVKVLYDFIQHLEECSLLCKTVSKFQLDHLIIVLFLMVPNFSSVHKIFDRIERLGTMIWLNYIFHGFCLEQNYSGQVLREKGLL